MDRRAETNAGAGEGSEETVNWRALGDCTVDQFAAALAGTALEVGSTAGDLYRTATPNTILLLAQLAHESDMGRSPLAVAQHNPLGLRPRGGGAGFLAFPTFAAAIREWAARIADPTYAYAATTTVEEYAHVYAPASDGNDEAAYVAAILATFATYKGSAMAQYDVAGLGKLIALPVPLIQKIIPVGQTNQRPGIPRQTPGYWVQHETANTAAGADAAMHARYLLQGADGSQVSWHFTVDDHQIYQHIPVNEVTWQAADGSGPGNMSGVSCEMCVNSDGDETAARHNAEALCAAVCMALGLGPDRVKRHYDFNAGDPNRHHCPDHMMSQGYWPTFVQNVTNLMKGTTVPTQPNQPDFPEGLDAALAAQWFGKVGQYTFNPIGPLSTLWLNRGKQTGQYPALVKVETFDTRTYFEFADGWKVWRPNDAAPVKELKAA